MNSLLAHIGCRPLNRTAWVPPLVRHPGQQAHRHVVRGKTVAPKAVCDLRADLQVLTGPDVEKVHAGSRCGTLAGSLRSGTTTGDGAGDSSGTRTRRRSGFPISAIDHSMSQLVMS